MGSLFFSAAVLWYFNFFVREMSCCVFVVSGNLWIVFLCSLVVLHSIELTMLNDEVSALCARVVFKLKWHGRLTTKNNLKIQCVCSIQIVVIIKWACCWRQAHTLLILYWSSSAGLQTDGEQMNRNFRLLYSSLLDGFQEFKRLVQVSIN